MGGYSLMAWNEGLNIELPKHWIEPERVACLLPPYYGNVVRGYADWLLQPHSSLKGLSWRDNLDFIYRPLNPSVREREEKDPTTYFVYEGIYTFFAGLVTGAILPTGQMPKETASWLKHKMVVNFAEVIQAISELGTGRISFDQEHNIGNKTYRLLSPCLIGKDEERKKKTFTGKASALVVAKFRPAARSFTLEYEELDNQRYYPVEINGRRISFLSELRLDRARPYPDERRLMCDFDVRELNWGWQSDGRCLPNKGSAVSLTDQFFGENKHHINLAILIDNNRGQFDIDSIIRTVVVELGLACLTI